MESIKGKTALVTGAGSGIGRETALLFAHEGAKTIVSDINEAFGQATVKLIKDAGGEAYFIKADISDAIEVESMISKITEVYGVLDCAVNNAGVEVKPTPTADCAEEDFDFAIKVNLKGTWLCMKYEIQQMLKQQKGAIVNVSSIAGLVGNAAMPAYSAAKHGVVGLTKTAALEYATAGIRVNAVCPAATRTPMVEQMIASMPELGDQINSNHPIGRMAEPSEIAASIVWLCSDAASFITGQPLAVDGGFLAN